MREGWEVGWLCAFGASERLWRIWWGDSGREIWSSNWLSNLRVAVRANDGPGAWRLNARAK